MDQQQTTRTCPACGSGEYEFRGRRKVEPEPGEKPAVETTYRCGACGKKWKVRVQGQHRRSIDTDHRLRSPATSF
jgi:DNA-directed RNA polymerase subunit RPC12/RpoP